MEEAINTRELWARVGGDRALLLEFLELFRLDYPAQIRAARKAVVEAQSQDLERTVHSLKGALANLSATTACQLATRLEEMGRSNDLTQAGLALSRLEQELGRVTTTLDIFLKEVTAEDPRGR